MAAAVFSRISERGGVGLVIAAVHVVAIYALCAWSPIVSALKEMPIEANIIDSPAPETNTPLPPVPQVVSVTMPTFDPPDITLTDEPAPNAITLAAVETPKPAPQVEAAPKVINEVAYLEPPAPKYPAESKRFGEQGLVVLRVLINELGRAARVEVERSSGFARLDAAARAAVERALFKPYVENGVPRMALATIPVEFSWKSRRAGRT